MEFATSGVLTFPFARDLASLARKTIGNMSLLEQPLPVDNDGNFNQEVNPSPEGSSEAEERTGVSEPVVCCAAQEMPHDNITFNLNDWTSSLINFSTSSPVR